MKKIIITILAVSMLLTLAACGSSAPETVEPDETPVVSETPDTPTTPEVEETPEVEDPAEPVPEQTPEVGKTLVVDPEPTPTPEHTPEVKPEPTPEVKPEPVVTPEPTPTPQPVVTPEPTPTPEVTENPNFSIEVEITDEPIDEELEIEVVIPEPVRPDYGIKDNQKVDVVGAQSWVEGEKHGMPKAGDTIIDKSGTKHVIQYDPVSGVLGAGLDVKYDIWTGYLSEGQHPIDGYSNNVSGRDTTLLSKCSVTGQMHTYSEWSIIARKYSPKTKGTYEGQIVNNWYKWEDNGWTWIGPR